MDKIKKEIVMRNILSIALVFVLAVSVVSVAGDKKVEIKVDGMTCDGCVNKVKTTLEKADGVKSAEVSLKDHSAVILYDDSKTDEASLKKTINTTGFKAVDAKDANKAKGAGCSGASAGCCGDKKS
jgi:copper chaperone CopZ